MQHLSTFLGLLSFTIIQISIFFIFLFFCFTPINRKTLKNFTILTFFYFSYNILQIVIEILDLHSNTTNLLIIISLNSLLLFNSYFVYEYIKDYKKKRLESTIFLLGLIPLSVLFIILYETNFEVEKTAGYLFITTPILLTLLTNIILQLQQKYTKKFQLGMTLSSTILIALSLTNYFISDKLNANNLHIEIINLNYLLLAIFKISILKKSITLKFVNTKNTTVDQSTTIDQSKAKEKFNKYHLTKREIEIAEYILEGKTYAEIANICYLAINTVTKHASNIFKKLNVSDKESFINNFK